MILDNITIESPEMFVQMLKGRIIYDDETGEISGEVTDAWPDENDDSIHVVITEKSGRKTHSKVKLNIVGTTNEEC